MAFEQWVSDVPGKPLPEQIHVGHVDGGSGYRAFDNDTLIDKLRCTEFEDPEFSRILLVLGERVEAHLDSKGI